MARHASRHTKTNLAKEPDLFLGFRDTPYLSSAVVTTIDKEQQISLRGVQFAYFPASVYAYVVGNNTLKQREEYA